jgi:hypothetical protein
MDNSYEIDPEGLEPLKLDLLIEIYAELFSLKKFIARYNAEKEGISEEEAMAELLSASSAYRKQILHWIYEKYGALPPGIMEALNRTPPNIPGG